MAQDKTQHRFEALSPSSSERARWPRGRHLASGCSCRRTSSRASSPRRPARSSAARYGSRTCPWASSRGSGSRAWRFRKSRTKAGTFRASCPSTSRSSSCPSVQARGHDRVVGRPVGQDRQEQGRLLQFFDLVAEEAQPAAKAGSRQGGARSPWTPALFVLTSRKPASAGLDRLRGPGWSRRGLDLGVDASADGFSLERPFSPPSFSWRLRKIRLHAPGR